MAEGQSTLFDYVEFDRTGKLENANGYVSHPLLERNAVEYRDFQVELARAAVESNLIVVVPTGLGKTIVALIAAAEMMKETGKKVIFLAPTRPLVMQHLETFRRYFLLKSLALFTGSTHPAERKKLWFSNKVIFATPQVIGNDLQAGLYTLDDVAFCIFDEAHRAVGNYSYVEVAERCRNAGIRILGLTASPGSKRTKVEDILAALNIEKVEIRNREDIDVNSFVRSIEEQIERVELSGEMKKLLKPIDELLHEKIVKLQRMGFLRYKKAEFVSRKDLLSVRAAIMARGKRGGYLFGAMHNSVLAIHAYHCSELLETQGIRPLRLYLERMMESEKKSKVEKSFLNDPRMKKVSEMLSDVSADSHPKVARLVDAVEKQIGEKDDSLIMVFTQYRDTIEVITSALAARKISFGKFIGQADRGKEKGMSQKEQKQTVQKFSDRKFNVLVASSIGEEGIDIPDVELVIFYEPIPSEIRYIQRKGRTGRSSVGKVTILLANGTRDEAYLRASSKREKKMNRLVKSMKEGSGED